MKFGFKNICLAAYNHNSRSKICGSKFKVEIDETHLYKAKNNKGRALKSQSIWLVGGIYCLTGEEFVTIVRKINPETLTDIICRNVKLVTTIITDS